MANLKSPLVKVLVTGSAGTIGRAVCKELVRRGHLVRGFDIESNPDLNDQVIGNLIDFCSDQKSHGWH